MWLLPTGELRVFDVNFDDVFTPSALEAGSTWYQRSTNTLFVSDGVNWIAQADPLVQSLQREFGARVVPQSVKPTINESGAA